MFWSQVRTSAQLLATSLQFSEQSPPKEPPSQRSQVLLPPSIWSQLVAPVQCTEPVSRVVSVAGSSTSHAMLVRYALLGGCTQMCAMIFEAICVVSWMPSSHRMLMLSGRNWAGLLPFFKLWRELSEIPASDYAL